MPEGDTIHRSAAALRAALVGHALTRFDAPRLVTPGPAIGTPVTAADARGKHLLVGFDDGHVLHTHLRMGGAWHVHRPGERWRRPSRQMRVVIGVPTAEAVCFGAPVVALLDEAAVARHPALRRLGPDLCDGGVDLDEVVARASRHLVAATPAGDMLLDQRIAAGIGNVYKSEVLFLHGLHPATPAGHLDPGTRRELYATAGALLRANLARSRRTTVEGGRPGALWVYDRAGRACRRCGAAVTSARLGRDARPTYWCPRCQACG